MKGRNELDAENTCSHLFGGGPEGRDYCAPRRIKRLMKWAKVGWIFVIVVRRGGWGRL